MAYRACSDVAGSKSIDFIVSKAFHCSSGMSPACACHQHVHVTSMCMSCMSPACNCVDVLQYCNNVVAAGGGGIKPALGQTWHSVPTTRLQLSLPPHANANLRQMTVSKSPRQVMHMCMQALTCEYMFTHMYCVPGCWVWSKLPALNRNCV